MHKWPRSQVFFFFDGVLCLDARNEKAVMLLGLDKRAGRGGAERSGSGSKKEARSTLPRIEGDEFLELSKSEMRACRNCMYPNISHRLKP
jgi:hypothetical protein